jgi:hypothetical protein
MVASSKASSSDWFTDCGCTTNISGRQSMFITYTEYPPNTKEVKGYNGVTSFASGYRSVRLICQLADGKIDTFILQDVVHLPGSSNLISQSQIIDKDNKAEQVNRYGLNLYNCHGKLFATTPWVDGLFVQDRVLDRAPQSTEYTDIDDSCLLAHKTTGPAGRHAAGKQMLQHRHVAHVGLKALEIMPNVVVNTPTMTGQCYGECCIECKVVRKPFPPTTSRATEPLQLVHPDRCSPLETAIGGGRYMLLFIDNAPRHTD